jgi:predicted nucleic acid-binding protein
VIVLDATVLIGHLNPQDAHHTRATELLAGFDVDEELGASVVTLAEAMVGPARAGEEYHTIARQAIRDLGIAEIAWGDDAAVRLATLRATTRLKCRIAACWPPPSNGEGRSPVSMLRWQPLRALRG